MQTGTELELLVSGLPTNRLAMAVDFIADQGSFKYNGVDVEQARVSGGGRGAQRANLRISFKTTAGETGEFEIGRIFVRFSSAEDGGDDRFVEGPWSFRFSSPEGPYP